MVDDVRRQFEARLGFDLEPFQVEALDALDADRSVLVAAPTGSGKTVVAEYAVARALATGGKAFYTTPIKALSNQKFTDLVRAHGAENVGLLTGDNNINGDAPIVVMTTEVLRNMIYARAGALEGLRFVVLDEVHYLQDAYRGPVWEEVIIHSAPDVRLVCLSATVSNVEQLRDWIETVRGATASIIEERRPIALHHLWMVGDKRLERPRTFPTLVDGKPNPEAQAIDELVDRGPRQDPRMRRSSGRIYTPRRSEVIEELLHEQMLPAIYFIFSRAACDDAVRKSYLEVPALTTAEERRQIREIAEAKVEALSDGDLKVLRYGEWLTYLEHGLAAHHAGMVPPFKEAVEACFVRGLVKVVFATETLALGINMPARSVVIEKLSKFSGERITLLTPGEYTQLTGRAGRRGLDPVGYAIVLWNRFQTFETVAKLVGTRTYELRSAFRPTYNMAANLVRRYAPDEAHHLLNLSFAQFRSDTDVVRQEARLERLRREIMEARSRAECDRGDIDEYRALWAAERDVSGRGRPSHAARRQEAEDALRDLKLGDVVVVPKKGRLVLIAKGERGNRGPTFVFVTRNARVVRLTAKDFPAPPRPVARMAPLPEPYNPKANRFHEQVAEWLRGVKVREDGIVGVVPAARDGDTDVDLGVVGARAHPVAKCPDVREHVRAAKEADRKASEARTVEREIRRSTESIARQFDRVLQVLERFDYVDGWALSEAGEQLVRLYHESDLLVVSALRDGLFDGLDSAGVASLLSTLTYEHRGSGPPIETAMPSGDLQARFVRLQRLCDRLNAAEEEAGLPLTRPPDAGFSGLAHAWAAGQDLERLLEGEELTGGDFVRNVKQLIDLLRQLGTVATDESTAAAARAAANHLFRGVVSASSVVGGATEEPPGSGAAVPEVDLVAQEFVDPGDDPQG